MHGDALNRIKRRRRVAKKTNTAERTPLVHQSGSLSPCESPLDSRPSSPRGLGILYPTFIMPFYALFPATTAACTYVWTWYTWYTRGIRGRGYTLTEKERREGARRRATFPLVSSVRSAEREPRRENVVVFVVNAASTKKTPSKKRLEDYEHRRRRRRRHRVPCPPINTDASPFQIASRNSTMSYPDRRGREKGGPTRPVGRTFG